VLFLFPCYANTKEKNTFQERFYPIAAFEWHFSFVFHFANERNC